MNDVFIHFVLLKIIRHETLGMYIKNVCEKMGVVYIKLAQILSTRSDIIKNEKSREDLSKINDSCNFLEYSEILAILKEEYNNKLQYIFKSISKNPIGSASISQVHKAVLLNGDKVALKVKRRDVLKNADKDIKNIKRLLKSLSIFSSSVRFLYKSNALDLYISWIKNETDFTLEKENIKSMYDYQKSLNEIKALKNNKKLLLVKLYDNLCTDNVIVMEYIKYPTINNIKLNSKNNILLKDGINSYLQYYFYTIGKLCSKFGNFIFKKI